MSDLAAAGGPEAAANAAALLRSTRPAAGGALRAALAFSVAHALLAVAAAWLLAGVLDAVAFHGAGLPGVAAAIAALLGVHALRAGAAFFAAQAGARAGARVRRNLFARLLAHVSALGPARLSGAATGDLVTTLSDAVAATEPYWRRWAPAMATAAVAPLAILIVVAPFDWISALALFATAPLIPLFMTLIGRSAEQANQRQWATLARLGGRLFDAIEGLADLKLIGAAKRETEVIARMSQDYRRDAMSVLRLAFLSSLALEFFAAMSIALVAALVGFRLMWGEIDYRAGLFALLLAPEFFAPLRAMGAQRHARMEAVAAAERILDLLARPAPAAAGGRRLAPGAAVALRLENAHVVHADGRRGLDGVTLEIARGEHVALVGPSGAGKSTLFALLLGFLEPSEGAVFIDGAPLAGLDLSAWRGLIAHVPQRADLFDGTLDENVAMGRAPAEGALDAAIDAALRAARAETFVARLPQGRRTLLGERGRRLSGGQAQRVALARAFFRPAPLVLLDEPTAHLDPATARLVDAATLELIAGRTAIVIAHRLETARRADRIIVLDAGRIVEDGPHDALVAAGGLYARLTAAAREAAGEVGGRRAA
ncbi:thiol reductant ABC exporter subunit CydD [Methylocella sp.]|uniref:thiol reductant ABC exporter subunit CydD n=1 Tax=Methylocella sp. TaxID=1978226 RepID=UPI00378420DD